MEFWKIKPIEWKWNAQSAPFNSAFHESKLKKIEKKIEKLNPYLKWIFAKPYPKINTTKTFVGKQ